MSNRAPFLMALTHKEPYVPIPEGGLFVWDGARDIEIGVIVELAVEGLVFEYFDLGWVMAEEGRFDLLTDAGMCINGLPYRLLSEELVEEEVPSPVPIRRATVRFGPLNPAKQTAVETLMAIYGSRVFAQQRGHRGDPAPYEQPPPLETLDPTS